MSEIITEHIKPPIPTAQFDWVAVRKNYEPGDPIGYGASEEAAIAALNEQESDDADQQ